jgi:hypothetical protein
VIVAIVGLAVDPLFARDAESVAFDIDVHKALWTVLPSLPTTK